MDTVPALFAAAVAADPTRPLLTYYDDGTGERTELSGVTLANWQSKTANLLVDGVGLGPGDSALVLLPPHWQTAAVLLGCWSAGLTVIDHGSADVAFVPVPRAAEVTVGDRYLLGLHPLGLPLREVPAGYLDYSAEVRGFGDRFVAPGPIEDQRALTGAAEARAAELGFTASDRILIDADRHPDPADWLLAPLAARATIVLCGHLDPDRLAGRQTAERITRVW